MGISQILRDCIPASVYQCVSKDTDAPEHSHKSMIINLACGSTIVDAESRSSITDGYVTSPPSCHILTHSGRHCAEAVLSFSNEITLVGSVAAPVLDFAAAWVQSSSGYDFLVAKTFPPSWCSLHRPVLSLGNPVSHWVYSAVDPLEPNGSPVFCHWGCGREHLDPNPTSQMVKITCKQCRSTCKVKVTGVGARTALSRKNISKVEFPAIQAKAEWSPPMESKGVKESKKVRESKELKGGKELKDGGADERPSTSDTTSRMPIDSGPHPRLGRGNEPTQKPRQRQPKRQKIDHRL